MKKKILLLKGIFSIGILLHAQVGINTQNPLGVFHIDAKGNNSAVPTAAELLDDLIVDSNGKMGIGMMPSTTDNSKLQITGSMSITLDGMEAQGKVLISDANGMGTWQPYKISYQNITLSNTGINIPYNQAANTFLYTGKSITLPPGRYLVNIFMVLSSTGTGSYSESKSYLLLRTTLSDSNTTMAPSNDIEGYNRVSGILNGASVYSTLSGGLFVNNTSGANKTYYYVAGDVRSAGTTASIRSFTGFLGYDSIIIYKLQD